MNTHAMEFYTSMLTHHALELYTENIVFQTIAI